jgi:hypothetical protein
MRTYLKREKKKRQRVLSQQRRGEKYKAKFAVAGEIKICILVGILYLIFLTAITFCVGCCISYFLEGVQK